MSNQHPETPTGLHDGEVGTAIAYAIEAHDWQRRKGTEIPYASHLLAVTALVLEHGGTPQQACAAVLHDVVEDCGGKARLGGVRARFGSEIGEMVAALSDSMTDDPDAKAPWRDRKVEYLQHLREHAGSPAMLVSLADKTHNAEAIVADLTDRADDPGLTVFDRFSAVPMAVAWYYLELALAFRSDETLPRRLTGRLRTAALSIHDHATEVPVELGARKQVAVGHAVHAGTWGVLPIEALEAAEAAAARFRNARTVGDIRRHPAMPSDRFAERLTWLGLIDQVEVTNDDPVAAAEELQMTDAEFLPDDLPLWEGWDLPIAQEYEFPILPDVPWEDNVSSLAYEVWAPQQLQAHVETGELSGPMQEVARDTLAVDSIEELRGVLDEAGLELVDDGARYGGIAYGIDQPYGGGWTPLPDQPSPPSDLTIPTEHQKALPGDAKLAEVADLVLNQLPDLDFGQLGLFYEVLDQRVEAAQSERAE